MRGAHPHHSRSPVRAGRVARRMMWARRMGVATGRGAWADHDHHELWSPSAEDVVRWLEEYQRDLEQEAADVASQIAELKATPNIPDA